MDDYVSLYVPAGRGRTTPVTSQEVSHLED